MNSPILFYVDLQAVRQQILQLLTPVTMNHTIIFLASLADVWYQRRRREGSGSKTSRGVPVASEEQIVLVDVVYAIKVKRELYYGLSFLGRKLSGN